MLRRLNTEEQTPELCLEAIRKDAFYLEYIHNKTPELCLEAIRSNGLVLECIENQTEEMCKEAIKENMRAFMFVKNQTLEMCIEVLKKDINMITYVHKTLENCLGIWIYFRIKNNIESDYFFKWEFGLEMYEKIIKTIADNKIYLEYIKLPDNITIEDLEDPITLEPLKKGESYAFFIEKEKWFLALSLENANKFIKEKFRGSNAFNIFVPTLNKLYPVANLKWVKL